MFIVFLYGQKLQKEGTEVLKYFMQEADQAIINGSVEYTKALVISSATTLEQHIKEKQDNLVSVKKYIGCFSFTLNEERKWHSYIT